ncbi:MAG: hypothetical protein J6X74_06495 [Bacteroidaceae bacterium]|nr:hypothetical protein [Bacteroidaceae bacterium]
METVPVIDPETGEPAIDPETQEPITEEVQISNAVFAEETENIEGFTVVKDQFTTIRMANGAAGSAIGGDVLVTTLEPGKYSLTTATRSGTTNFTVGGEVVATITSGGTVETSTTEFTVSATAPLYIAEQSATTQYSDYVLIRKIADVESYDIAAVIDAENGSVEIPTAAAAGAVIKPVLTADAGYELESSEITVKDAEGAEVTVADGAFTMPASAVTVTVKATFVPKKIYIETDLTSQFLALTDKSTWTSETSSGVGIAEWAAPQVTVAGNKYYMIENYVEGQDKKLATGGVMYNTIKGLTPGLYTIELYGSAALTPGRSDMTTDFEEGDEASLHAVYLYAEAGGNKTQKYIPCLIESNFNNRGGEESIPTASLDNVEVGEDGTIKIGIYKEVGLTNWHIVQLKSVTAKILASDLLEAAVVAAGMIDDDDVPEALYREIQETIATYNKAYDTAEEYLTAVEALKAVVAKAEAYAPLAEAIEAGEDIKENVSKESAIAEYDEAIAPIISAYEAVAVEDIPAATVRVTAANVTLAKVQDAPNSDLTIVAENSEWINRSGTYAGDCAERWNGSAYEAGKVLYQRIEGLIPNATYEVQFLAVANVAWISAATGEGIAQVFANDAAKDIEVYDQTGCDPTQYKHTLQATADAEGVFEYGLQNVATGGNWYVAKAVALTFKGASYAINYADGMVGGMVSGPVVAFEGDEVALTVTPAEGYELASIAVTNEAGEEIEVMYDSWDGIATFEMPAEAVYVAATFQEAYVKLSDFAIASTGILDEDGDVEITGTYEFETAGSYSEMFFGEVVYDVQITAEGLAEPIEVSITGDELDGEVSDYVANLVEGTQYTANLVGVHVWDYISFTEIFTKVAELGGVLATTQFTVINQPVIEPLLVDINVERYVGYGYTPTVAEVDFTDALEFLGVDEITTDMLSFVNPDLTTISYADYMAANYDGWCDETGKATNWGSTTKICVKFFQAVEDGKYEICDMNGADVVGTTYTVRWVANVDTKVVVFTTNVTFVEEPTPAPEIAAEVDVPVVIQAGTAYEGATATFNIEDVTGPLFLDDISEAAQYIVNVTDGSFVPNSTDGWRDANGDAATWGTGDGMVCVKIQQPASGSIDYIGAIDQTYQDGDTYTAKWGFVNTASNTAVVLNINITFSDDPTGFAELKAADSVKPNGKYIEGNKIVIWQNGTKFSTSGTIAR